MLAHLRCRMPEVVAAALGFALTYAPLHDDAAAIYMLTGLL